MRVIRIAEHECSDLLKRAFVGRLACSLNNEPYVVPVCFAYDPGYIYVFSTLGKKIDWMRQNPKVCLQIDEIGSRSNWTSVIVNGKYVELREPQFGNQREHAIERLGQYSEWWRTPLAQRRETTNDSSIQTVFFRVDIESISGLRAIPEAE
jgi:nitroimidazol reductase NimA-like FMN-containing flavoprotein (pyridoxamine 5'-phosphate oxidase superfamily)